jgi:hypothetical protein
LHPIQNIHDCIFLCTATLCRFCNPILKQSYQISTKQCFSNGALQKREVPKNERNSSTGNFCYRMIVKIKCYNFHKLQLKQFLFSFDNDSFAQMFPNCCSVTTDTTTTFRRRFFLLWNCALVTSTKISWCSNYITVDILGSGHSNSTRYCSVLLSTVRILVYHSVKPKMKRICD